MTFDEMERGMKVLQENMTVQGVMMYRVENNMGRLESNMGRLESNMDRLESNLDRLEVTVERLANGQGLMQAAMHSLFESMDRFIRGLESNGHGRQ